MVGGGGAFLFGLVLKDSEKSKYIYSAVYCYLKDTFLGNKFHQPILDLF